MKLDSRLFSLMNQTKSQEAISIIENIYRHKAPDSRKRTLLHYAAILGNSEITQHLLSKGCQVDIQDKLGYTPLMEALLGQHDRVSKLLLFNGADPLISNKDNQNSLYFLFAQQKSNPFIVQMCLVHFKKKCAHNAEEAAKSLISVGCQLHHAFHLRDAKIIEHMILQGCKVNYVDSNHIEQGYTVLHASVALGNPEIVSVLLEYGADTHATDVDDKTSFFYIFSRSTNSSDFSKQIEILEAHLDAGAEPMSISSDGLFQCASILMSGPPEAVRLLLKKGLDLNAQDSRGETALHYLAWNRNPKIVEELKPHASKLNLDTMDERRMNPMHIAVCSANVSMLKFMLEHHDADINIISDVCMSPYLYYAYAVPNEPDLEYSSDQCVDILLQRNADFQFDVGDGSQIITIFDVNMVEENHNRVDRLKPVVAHVALQEKIGTPISELIYSKIESEQLMDYFEDCRDVLEKVIVGNVTIFKLLAADDNKMAKYLNNKELVLKLIRLERKQWLTSKFPYYSSILRKLFVRGMKYKALKHKAAEIIFECSKGWLAKDSIVTERLIDFYLNDHDLRQLYQL